MLHPLGEKEMTPKSSSSMTSYVLLQQKPTDCIGVDYKYEYIKTLHLATVRLVVVQLLYFVYWFSYLTIITLLHMRGDCM